MESAKQGRSFDVVVYGANGLTGKYVMEELVNYHPEIKWAAAGRNRERIEDALKTVGFFTGKSLESVHIIVADVNDDDALKEMCSSAKIVINCVGPFRFYGEKVVKKAVECGAHHLDVCGEPQFLLSTQCKYFDAAKENKVYVIGACGFDSIPCDIGIEVMKTKFSGHILAVETFLEMNRIAGATGNYATWVSAIHGLAHRSELRPLWKELKTKIFKPKHDGTSVVNTKGLSPKRRYLFKKHLPRLAGQNASPSNKGSSRWCVPFIGSDKSVVRQSQLYSSTFLDDTEVDVLTYFCVDSVFSAITLLFVGLMFAVLCMFSYGRHLLEEYPELFSCGAFSKNPPVREEDEKSSYTMTFQAIGWPHTPDNAQYGNSAPKPTKTMNMVLRAQDNGYVTTAICVTCAAEVVLHEIDKLPDEGGVLTPAAAFKKTSLVERMAARGLKYQVVE